MHISILDNDEYNIYLNKEKIENINFEIYDEVEQYFRKLFIILKNNYNISISGYYDIKIYIDKINGAVIEIRGKDIDYMDFFDNQVEMNIEIKKDNFIYSISDYFFLNNKENIILYSFHDNIYIYLKDKIDYKDYLKLMEFGTIVYGYSAKKVLNNGKKLFG